MPRHILHLVIFLLVLPAAAPAQNERDFDFELAAEAVARGEVLPLATILDRVAQVQTGKVIEVKLEFGSPRYQYEVELITPDGRLVEVELDASTGDILSLEQDD